MIPSQTLFRGLARHARRLTPLPPISAAGTSASASASATIPTATRERARIGEYTISRSTGGELPVYSEHTRGTVWKTIVRKIDGDVMGLRDDLATYMKEIHIDPLRPAPGVSVKPTNRNLIIKGKWVDEVKGFLEGKGF